MPMIPLKEIDYDKRYYPRANGATDWVTVLRYQQVLTRYPDRELPDVVVVPHPKGKGGVRYLMLDGLHRHRAYGHAGRKAVPAEVRHVPRTMWLRTSIELNRAHGRPLDQGDKAWCAVLLAEEGLSTDQAADVLQMETLSLQRMVDRQVVWLNEAQVTELGRKGAGGRSCRKVGRRYCGIIKSALAVDGRDDMAALEHQHPVTSHDVMGILDSMIAALEARVVDATDAGVAGRIRVISRLLRSLGRAAG